MGTRQDFIKKVAKIQKEIKCGKSQFNKFGNFYHRNIEDVMEAIKPYLGDLMLNINEEMVMVGERYYVKSTSTLTDGEHEVSSTAYAREPESAKGLSDGQLSGATGSYASKYSLGKLLLLDDNKDMDSNEITEQVKSTEKGSTTKPSRFSRKPKDESTSSKSEEGVEDSQEKKSELDKVAETNEIDTEKAMETQSTPSRRSFRRNK